MLKKLTILATLLGSALALPACQTTVRTRPAYAANEPAPPPPRPSHEVDRGPRPRPMPARWVPLAESYAADSERQFINLIGRGGEFRKLRVEGVRGTPVITRVAIEFMDKEMQVVDLNARLTRGADQVIDLNGRGRAINRIIVYSEPQYGGKYSVFGT